VTGVEKGCAARQPSYVAAWKGLTVEAGRANVADIMGAAVASLSPVADRPQNDSCLYARWRPLARLGFHRARVSAIRARDCLAPMGTGAHFSHAPLYHLDYPLEIGPPNA